MSVATVGTLCFVFAPGVELIQFFLCLQSNSQFELEFDIFYPICDVYNES